MPVKRGIEDGTAEPEDSEGHMPFKKVDAGEPEPDSEDTEGNAVKFRG